MTTVDKIAALRAVMNRENIDAYIISGSDPHNSEYLPDAWKQREWISGFTGSFGTIVITQTQAGLWTDSRYFIQAEKQLQRTGIELHKLKMPGVLDYPEWLAANLPPESKVGLDGFCTPVAEFRKLTDTLKSRDIKIVEKTDLMGEIWLDRPALPETPLFLVSEKNTGRSSGDKIKGIRTFLKENKADYLLISALDEIAWLYNIRGNDIAYNPVAMSYAVIGNEQAWLFVKERKVSADILKELNRQGIEVRDYHHLFLFLNETDTQACFCIDPGTLNCAVYNKLNASGRVVEKPSPVILVKSLKNSIETEGFRKACLKDSVALSKLFYWIESNTSNHITESMVSDKISSLRALDKDFVSDSFKSISAYGANAALPHYAVDPQSPAELEAKGLYLLDSGGQYSHGTTDVTRTIPLGKLTETEKEDYTLVLKGAIALSRCIFPKGTKGCNIDIIARQYLWSNLRNYGHGTGHGIGFFLNVHEGPQAIRQDLKEQLILPGMVTSNEPGMYREGSHGIRHENMVLCIPVANNEFGEWYGFETLTLCYFDTSALQMELLDETEKEWLNNYHQTVYEKTAPFLNREEAEWLARKTQPI